MNIFETLISTPLGYVMHWLFLLCNDFILSIFLFTLLTRALMLPLSIKQQNSSAKMAAIQPRIQEAREKYKNNPQKQSEEIRAIQQEAGVSTMGGCLPLLIQMPLLFGLIAVIQKPLTYIIHVPANLITEAVSKLSLTGNYLELQILNRYADVKEQLPGFAQYPVENLNLKLFGLIDISQTPSLKDPSLLWLIPILTGVLQILQTLMMNHYNKKNGQPVMSNFLMTFGLPLMFVWFAFSVPGGVGFYWICSSLIGIVQTFFLSTYYSPGRINARGEFARAKKRLEAERNEKEA